VRLDGELDRNLVADDQAAVLQRAAKVIRSHGGRTRAGLKPVTETPGVIDGPYEVLESNVTDLVMPLMVRSATTLTSSPCADLGGLERQRRVGLELEEIRLLRCASRISLSW